MPNKFMEQHWREALGLDLGLLCVAIFLLALIPPDTLIIPEWIAMVGAVVAVAGLFTHIHPKLHLPGDRWCYLVTLWLSVGTLVGYLTNLPDAPLTYQVAVPVFLAGGGASAFAGHLIDGGVRNSVRR